MAYAESIDLAVRMGVAALGGLAVGIEREWSQRATERAPRFAGVRTFLLLGLLGGVLAELWRAGLVAAAVALLSAALILVIAAYVLAARGGDVDGTTEVAAFLVVGQGLLAGGGQLVLASAVTAVTAFVLVEKTRIHDLVFRLRSEELAAGARFAVLALVVLPLLPAGPYGPDPGLRPREIWSLVLLFSGLGFAGYAALRIAGPGRGYGIAGLLGGLISSTAVTWTFTHESRRSEALGGALGLGVIAACTLLYLRVLVLTLVLQPALALATLPGVVLPLLVGLLAVRMAYRGGQAEGGEPRSPGNPLRLLPAIQMALTFQAVLFLMALVVRRFGTQGVFVSAAVLGFTDVDALTVSLAKLAPQGAGGRSAAALMVGVLSNTALKLLIVLVLGRGRFRRVAGLGLGGLLVATAAAVLLLLNSAA